MNIFSMMEPQTMTTDERKRQLIKASVARLLKYVQPKMKLQGYSLTLMSTVGDTITIAHDIPALAVADGFHQLEQSWPEFARLVKQNSNWVLFLLAGFGVGLLVGTYLQILVQSV